MSQTRLSAPAGLETVAPDDVERVERWSALQRAELVRLALHLRKVTRDAVTAEHECAGIGMVTAGRLDAIDVELDRTHAAAHAAVDAAAVEAGARVESARALAQSLLRDAGLDPAAVGGPVARKGAAAMIRRPRRAQELWESSVLSVALGEDADDAPVGAAGPVDPLTRTDGEFWTDVPDDRRSVEWLRRRAGRKKV